MWQLTEHNLSRLSKWNFLVGPICTFVEAAKKVLPDDIYNIAYYWYWIVGVGADYANLLCLHQKCHLEECLLWPYWSTAIGHWDYLQPVVGLDKEVNLWTVDRKEYPIMW
jgi:hypothetical protein